MCPVMINPSEFSELIAVRAGRLLQIAHWLAAQPPLSMVLTRPLVGDLLSQAVQMEELLDAYGARNNRQWSRFRSLTATLKLFANVGYKLLHIQHSLLFYQLPPVERDFSAATAQLLESIRDLLVRASDGLLAQAARLNLSLPADPLGDADYAERLPPGRLLQDRPMRKIKSAVDIITYLATAYLNLAAESELLHLVQRVKPSQYSSCFPNPLSEDNIRYLKFRFHCLQSLYDTHVSETEIEFLDTGLPVLRGHISIVYHLLEIATDLAHYYERHLNIRTGDSSLRRQPVISTKTLLAMLMDYAIAYAGQYLDHGQHFCHAMLKRYAEVGNVDVPVPSYRGFHVRPATLIAKIVRHYGSDIKMELDGQIYDAGSPMDIFRANEKINAWKRRWLVAEIERIPPPRGDLNESQIRAAVLHVVLKLAQEGKLILYQQPLQLSNEFSHDGILLEKVTAEIARLQATGQIDIRADLSIRFAGDQRVLDDLELLARSGYGEDHFGNNTTLPRELAYLRR